MEQTTKEERTERVSQLVSGLDSFGFQSQHGLYGLGGHGGYGLLTDFAMRPPRVGVMMH